MTGYVLKDAKGNYVGVDSLDTSGCLYCYSKFLTNGFYTYSDELRAKDDLISLKTLAKNIGFEMDFHLERINWHEVMMQESKTDIPLFPFIFLKIKEGNVAIA